MLIKPKNNVWFCLLFRKQLDVWALQHSTISKPQLCCFLNMLFGSFRMHAHVKASRLENPKFHVFSLEKITQIHLSQKYMFCFAHWSLLCLKLGLKKDLRANFCFLMIPHLVIYLRMSSGCIFDPSQFFLWLKDKLLVTAILLFSWPHEMCFYSTFLSDKHFLITLNISKHYKYQV